jgi:lipoprotein-releasing system permease protein
MPLESRIARRYLWAARKQAHTAFLSLISMLGLAIGVWALLISIALLSGLQGQIKVRLMQSSPQLLVEPVGKNTIANSDAIVAAAKKLGMRDVRPFISGIGYGTTDDQRRHQPVRIRSYAGKRTQEILVTRGLAVSLQLDVGDRITIIAPRTRLTPFGPVPVWKKYRIARFAQPAGDESNTDAWIEQSEAASLFGTNGEPTAIEMYGDAAKAEEVQAALTKQFPQAQFKTWKEINRPLFLALRLEKVVMFASISLIIFVAALNLISSLSMLILEKRPSIGILRTLGATEGNILSLFMQVGLLIGISGTLLGNIAGLGMAWAANRYHLVPLPTDVYFISFLPFTLDAGDIAGVNIVAIVLSVVATWYPARIASRLEPIVAIRED